MDATNYLLKILDGIIGRILNTFEAQPKVLAEWAKSVLLWFCCTKQPPTMGALAGTLTKKVSSGNMSHGGIPNIDFIDRRCKRLVSVDTWTSVVQMSHPEIVISIKKCWTKDLAETQMKITTACLHYLLLDDFGFGHDNSDHLQETLRKHPFVEYAAKMRSGHVCESLKTPDDTAQHIKFSVLQLLRAKEKMELDETCNASRSFPAKWQYSTFGEGQITGNVASTRHCVRFD